jgi:hypothetical protein
MTKSNYNSKEKVYKFLKNHAVAVLSTVSPDGTPNASPIYFVPDKELNIYFITKSDTKKSQNIESSNSNAAITVVDSIVPMTVQAKGIVREVEEPDFYVKIAQANAKEQAGFRWPPPLYKLKGEGHILLYKFAPYWLRVADFSEHNDVTRGVFHQLIP